MKQQSRSRNTLVRCPFPRLHQRDKPSRGCIGPLPCLARPPSATSELIRRDPFRRRSLSCKPARGCIEPLRSLGRLPCDTNAKLRQCPLRRLCQSNTKLKARTARQHCPDGGLAQPLDSLCLVLRNSCALEVEHSEA